MTALGALHTRSRCKAQRCMQVAALLAGHPILIEGFTAFLPDKIAFLQLDDRSGGPTLLLKAHNRCSCNIHAQPCLLSCLHAQ